MDSERASSASTRDQTGLTPDERIGFLFQPDSLLSAHYFGTLRRKTISEPEKRLMLAIDGWVRACSDEGSKWT